MHKIGPPPFSLLWDVLFPLLGALALILLLAFCSGEPARAHSFYPWECCHDQDCWAAGPGEREPAPRLVGNGWQLADGTVVPFEATRQSPDGRFHVCRRNGDPKGALITPHGKPPCPWVPEGGS